MKNTLPCVFLLLIVGCGPRLIIEKTVNVSFGKPAEGVVLEAISKAQTINVSAKTSSGKFSVYVYLEKDKNAAEQAIAAGKPNDKIIAHQQKSDSAEFKASIPANEEAAVMVSADEGKKLEVSLKITK